MFVYGYGDAGAMSHNPEAKLLLLLLGSGPRRRRPRQAARHGSARSSQGWWVSWSWPAVPAGRLPWERE